MQSVTELLPVTPSIDQLARIIGNVAAPAFLLGAVASFISVLLSRINRVIDRAQFIHGIPENDTSRSFLKSDLPRLRRRAALLNRSLFSAIVAAILPPLSSSSPLSAHCCNLRMNMASRSCSWLPC